MTQRLLILGTGGGVHDVLDIVEALNAIRPTWEPIGFLDDARSAGEDRLGLPVLGRLTDAARFPDALLINTIGSDRNYTKRPVIVASTGQPPERFATLVHPSASVSSRARLGRGVSVAYGVSVGGGVTIGDHVTLCPSATIGHDATIDDYALIAPGAIISGHVQVGRACYIGAGAMIRQTLRIGPNALVGMGAVVTRDVLAATVAVGCPARPLFGGYRTSDLLRERAHIEASPI